MNYTYPTDAPAGVNSGAYWAGRDDERYDPSIPFDRSQLPADDPVDDDLLGAALAYADLGWRIHPCRPRDKRPLLNSWPAQATSDPGIIRSWWSEHPTANIGMATGDGSGVWVLDIDGADGERAIAELERERGPLPEWYAQQWTGSGRGWQAVFSWPDDRIIRNSGGKLGPKIDTRGRGGYVILPPSIHPTGNRYRWAADREPWDLPPEPAPSWLVELLDPPPKPNVQHVRHLPPELPDAYLRKAVEAELVLVAQAPIGQRNEQLYASAFTLLRFAVAGRLENERIVQGLANAAMVAGLSHKEVAATIQSAAKARGIANA